LKIESRRNDDDRHHSNLSIKMTSPQVSPAHRCSVFLNRIFYGISVLLCLYFLIANRDYGAAASNMGIALIFDPFEQSVAWRNRPFYQWMWLIAHISVLGGLLAVLALR